MSLSEEQRDDFNEIIHTIKSIESSDEYLLMACLDVSVQLLSHSSDYEYRALGGKLMHFISNKILPEFMKKEEEENATRNKE